MVLAGHNPFSCLTKLFLYDVSELTKFYLFDGSCKEEFTKPFQLFYIWEGSIKDWGV